MQEVGRVLGAGSGRRRGLSTHHPAPHSTGERNGFTVLTEAEFYDFHLTTPDLTVMLIRVGGGGRRRAGEAGNWRPGARVPGGAACHDPNTHTHVPAYRRRFHALRGARRTRTAAGW